MVKGWNLNATCKINKIKKLSFSLRLAVSITFVSDNVGKWKMTSLGKYSPRDLLAQWSRVEQQTWSLRLRSKNCFDLTFLRASSVPTTFWYFQPTSWARRFKLQYCTHRDLIMNILKQCLPKLCYINAKTQTRGISTTQPFGQSVLSFTILPVVKGQN